MMREEIEEAYGLEFPGLLFMDNLDEAIIGVGQSAAQDPAVAYSAEKILECLVKQGMGFHEAREFMEYNIEGAFVGDHTPLIIDDLF